MYHFDGQLSKLANATQSILDATPLNTNPKHKDSFTLAIFRVDPTDQYRYILAHSG